jgi:2-keto-4-pentenoate hydratase/2-oxohepta-3-ene-1,7-dioic acid hydratase in catechol pathway
MRLISYQSASGPRVAGLREGLAVDLNQTDSDVPHCMKMLLAQGSEGLARAGHAIQRGRAVRLSELKLLAPVPRPEKVICVGLNYADHAKESGIAVPGEPVFFTKFASAVSAHGSPIVLPAVSSEVDYEAELVVVIGQGGRNITKSEAGKHVAGYCCGNDVSARDWQLRKPGGQWLLGKSFDTFAPFGPALVTADEVADPNNLGVQLRLNGEVKQDSRTSQFIFKVDELVSYVSKVCTLVPGDVIFTGTPPGVGFARKPPLYLRPGDTVEVEIEKLGVLRNPVVAEASGG